MSDGDLSPGLLADLQALSGLEQRFTELHGEQAMLRWRSVGGGGGSLDEIRGDAIAVRGSTPEIWETLAWELSRRVSMLEQLRRASRQDVVG